MKRLVAVGVAAVLATGCASDFSVYGDAKGEDAIKGFPVRTPAMVMITTRTEYELVAGMSSEFSRYCTPEETTAQAFLPLGDVIFVDFEPAPLGKSEFALDFGEGGILSKVSINSDATAGADSVTGFLEKVLPFFKAPLAAAGDGDGEGEGEGDDPKHEGRRRGDRACRGSLVVLLLDRGEFFGRQLVLVASLRLRSN